MYGSVIRVIIQCVLNSLDLGINFGLGIRIRHRHIQTILFERQRVICLCRNLHRDTDLIICRNTHFSRRGCHADVDINQRTDRNLNDLAGGNSQLDLMSLGVIDTTLDYQVLSKCNRQSVATKDWQLDCAGLCIIRGLMNNASQSSGNRFIAFCHAQNASVIGDICNKFTLNIFHFSNLRIDIISDSFGGWNIIVGCSICRDLSYCGFIQLHKLHPVPDVHTIIRHAEINNALNLAGRRQSRNHLTCLCIFRSSFK